MFTGDVIFFRKKNSSEKEVRALIAREVAPLAAEVDMFVNSSTASASGQCHCHLVSSSTASVFGQCHCHLGVKGS